MKGKIIIAIDPGAPKERDNSATTGIFVGPLSKIERLEGYSLKIQSNNIDEGIKQVANTILNLKTKYELMGYEVIVVIEEYKNYSFNQAANSFSKNETSQLIGGIKTLVGSVVMQTTMAIKSKYGNPALVKAGFMKKEGGRFKYTSRVTDVESGLTRHEFDAFRHYLEYRSSQGYVNRASFKIVGIIEEDYE